MNQKTAEKIIDDHFEPLVGQEVAKVQLKHWILGGYCSDGYLEPILIGGAPGLGKTELMTAIVKIIPLVFPDRKGNIHMATRGKDVGSLSSFIQEIVISYVSNQSGGLLIDEVGETNPATLGFLRSMMQPKIDRTDVVLKHGDEEIVICPRKFFFCYATNEIDKLSEAFRSRCKEVHLQEYNDDEMAEILFRGATKNGLTFAENSLRKLAVSMRGTARSVVEIVNDLYKVVKIKGKNTVSKEDVSQLLKIRDSLPLGVRRVELQTLLHLEHEGPLQRQVLAFRNGLMPAQQVEHEKYLFKRGLLSIGAKREITASGLSYLTYLRKHKLIPARPSNAIA